jgi:hypothetical protein
MIGNQPFHEICQQQKQAGKNIGETHNETKELNGFV